ncbi:hypothetical protein K491DRAFT_612671 [Lophiostoma macrostomum CBS 122681]|uniref:Xylanolytic transcriptional activator regulatory domain-containing protein n=1 Tax=Lophiostoma macrostomum CBS 122681 TaxID=1314788 RepID=A0A6A6SNB5_9PLEO|nr:hypothetical protein K491DRAFT_612671 [Lophiostoma macrostomum CBS 122681]
MDPAANTTQSRLNSRSRPKPQLACDICKSRKRPCTNCISHGYPSSCAYSESSGVRKPTEWSNAKYSPPDVLAKLKDLENLVHLLMSEREQPSPRPMGLLQASNLSGESAPCDTADVLPNNFGRLSLDQAEASYVGSDHWAAVLDEIADLKHHLEEENVSLPISNPSTSAHNDEGPLIFRTDIRPASREEILQSFPSKTLVDDFVSTYFLQREHIPIFLHQATFLKEYNRFWANPNEVSIMWVGLLYAIMCLGTKFQATYVESRSQDSQNASQAQDCRTKFHEYRERTVQCLLAGRYTRPGRYCIETLLMYFMAEHLHHTDGQFENWLLMGQIIRISLRLGLHRDPFHSSKISIFEGEIRRRIWTAIKLLDIETSCQMGLPTMIKEADCDTRKPLNLLDEDLDEDMRDLPPPRSDTVVTPVLYLCVRSRILSVVKISELSTYSDTCELDDQLLEERAAIPLALQYHPVPPSQWESIDVMMHRIYLDVAFQHSRCMLHRRYLVPARTNELYAKSRTACIDAALALLRHQQILHHEARPGGRIEMRRWKFSSFLDYGLLLGSTILCVDLNLDLQEGLNQQEHWQMKDRVGLIDALHGAYQIFLQSWDTSLDSRKGATAIRTILAKMGVPGYTSPGRRASSVYAATQSPSWTLEELFESRFPHDHSFVRD